MLGWFVETTLVASGLAAVAVLGGRIRSIGPTARHVLWLVVLVKLMTPPLISWPWATDWASIYWPPTAQAVPIEDADDSHSVKSSSSPIAEMIILTALNVSGTAFPLPTDPTDRIQAVTEHFDSDTATSPHDAMESDPRPVVKDRLSLGLTFGWLFLTVIVGIGQAARILRFRGRLRPAGPAPDHLVDETDRIARSLGVRAPELLVVTDLGTPMLWCLGRPKLLLPAQLVETLDLGRWRGILTHELAHLRRGDHWVSRLELIAGLIWWWNPIYWLARTRLDAEAELACDAWVVSTLPKDRLTYAEALFDICSTLSKAETKAPALGVAGSGRFFEKRLTMILHGYVPCRLSPTALLTACLLALFALPSWSTAKPVPSPTIQSSEITFDTTITSTIADDDDDDDDDQAEEADDDDNDDDDEAKVKAKAEAKKLEADRKKVKAEAKKLEADRKKAKTDAKKAKSEAKKAKTEPKEHKAGFEFDLDLSKLGENIEKEIQGKLGPDFELKIEELGEKIEKEIEGKFGPDFEKKMEAFGKQLEAKLGPGSDFEKKMKDIGKEMEAKFGPGSDFEKKMKDIGKEMEARFGPGSDFEKSIKEQAEALASTLQKKLAKTPSTPEASAPKTGTNKGTAKAPASSKERQRERRIAAIEDQIRKLADELKALKADDQD